MSEVIGVVGALVIVLAALTYPLYEPILARFTQPSSGIGLAGRIVLALMLIFLAVMYIGAMLEPDPYPMP